MADSHQDSVYTSEVSDTIQTSTEQTNQTEESFAMPMDTQDMPIPASQPAQGSGANDDDLFGSDDEEVCEHSIYN